MVHFEAFVFKKCYIFLVNGIMITVVTIRTKSAKKISYLTSTSRRVRSPMAYCFLLSSKNISFACNAGNFLAYDVSEVSTVLTIENGIIDVQKAINFIFSGFRFL